MRHSKKLLTFSAVFLLGLAAAYAQREQTGKTLKVDIDLVLINASVTDADNKPVMDLQKENFQLYEDRVEQEIRYFSTETTPVSLGIIFDASHSMEGKIDLARKAAVTFLESGTPEDEYFLVEFNNKATIAQDFTSDIARLRNHLIYVPPQGATAMYDALYLGLNKVKKDGQNTRKALLLITDGEDNHSRYTRGNIHEFVKESDVQIYSIDLGRALIGDLSEMTGGYSYRTSMSGLEKVCEKIASELKNQYVLGYVPSNTTKNGDWRKVRVKVTPPQPTDRLSVRSKEGYYAPKG
jgi:Ca-activated chloride channel family protein